MAAKVNKRQARRNRIEENKELITSQLSGASTVKRLNNLNWIRHELSWSEPRTLFQMPAKEQAANLDFNNMKNIGTAYDYIIDNADEPITVSGIYAIHSILCDNTNIAGGMPRSTNKVLRFSDKADRFHAPDYREIPSTLNDIVYQLNDPSRDVLTRAFDAHYELIALQPFDDFNKRTARMIMNWVLLQGGYRPIIFNKKTDKQKYVDAIAAMTNGDRKKYMSYMNRTFEHSQNEIIKQLNKSNLK